MSEATIELHLDATKAMAELRRVQAVLEAERFRELVELHRPVVARMLRMRWGVDREDVNDTLDCLVALVSGETWPVSARRRAARVEGT